MSFLRQGNTIPRTHSRCRRDQTSPSQDRSHQGYAPTSESETGSRLPQTSGILQKIHQGLCKNGETTNNVNSNGCKIRMEGNTSLHLHETERCHHPSTHSAIPRPVKPYIVYRCLRRRLRSSALTDTQWNRIPGSFLIAHVYRHPKEMEYTRTRSIRYLFHHQEMELLPTRNRHHSKKQPQALAWSLNGKNENTKINRWGLELASYNITFEWISGAKNKAAHCLS